MQFKKNNRQKKKEFLIKPTIILNKVKQTEIKRKKNIIIIFAWK